MEDNYKNLKVIINENGGNSWRYDMQSGIATVNARTEEAARQGVACLERRGLLQKRG